MAALNLHTVAQGAVGAALATHLFSQLWEPPIQIVLAVASASLVGLPLAFMQLDLPFTQAAFLSSCFQTTYVATLLSSIAVYRLVLHPLRRFPGPRGAALSKFWHAQLSTSGQAPVVLEQLHRKYGDIVRIGPNELSIREVSAINSILGANARMNKGPWYDGGFAAKGSSLHAIRDYRQHAHRRRFWDRGFSGKAINDYSVFIKERGEEWVSKLRGFASSGTDFDLALYCSFLSFDTMGDLGFGGEGFGMMASGHTHFYMEVLEKAMRAVSTFSEIPWIMPLLASLPANAGQKDLYDFSMATMLARKERGNSGKPDVFHYLVGEDQDVKSDHTLYELDADIRLLIVAGSDTTATTLSFATYHLLTQPNWMEALQQEVEKFRNIEYEVAELAKLPVLNAIINETLRLDTPVPSKSQRVVPSGGVMLAGQYIPAHAIVSVPMKVTMRDERYFAPAPAAWRPERWISPEKEIAMNLKAFIPFSAGPFNCAGRLVALIELRYWLTLFALNFNGKLADNTDPKAFENSVLEHFTVQKGPMLVRLSNRKV